MDEQLRSYPRHQPQHPGEHGRQLPQRGWLDGVLHTWHYIAGEVRRQLQPRVRSNLYTHGIPTEVEERLARYIPAWLHNALAWFQLIVLVPALVLKKLMEVVVALFQLLFIDPLQPLGLRATLKATILLSIIVLVFSLVLFPLALLNNVNLVLGETLCSLPVVNRSGVCQGRTFGGLEPQIPMREFPKCSGRSNKIDQNWCKRQHVLHVAPDLDAILTTVRQFASLLGDATDIQNSDNSTFDFPSAVADISTELDTAVIGDTDFHRLRRARAAHDCDITAVQLQNTRSRPAGAALWHKHRRAQTHSNERRSEGLTESIEFWWRVTRQAEPLCLIQDRAKLFSSMLTERQAAGQDFVVANKTGFHLIQLEKAVCGTLKALQRNTQQADKQMRLRVEEERDVVPRSQMLHLSKARSREDMGKSLCRVLGRSVGSANLVVGGLQEENDGIAALSGITNDFVKTLEPDMRSEPLDTWAEADDLESKLWKKLEVFWCHEDWPADDRR